MNLKVPLCRPICAWYDRQNIDEPKNNFFLS